MHQGLLFSRESLCRFLSIHRISLIGQHFIASSRVGGAESLYMSEQLFIDLDLVMLQDLNKLAADAFLHALLHRCIHRLLLLVDL